LAGYTVDILEQEPILDDSKTVIEIEERALQKLWQVLDESIKSMIICLPEVYENADKMEQLMDRQALCKIN
jgi:hypothetical protein